jgi:hypothetical protein
MNLQGFREIRVGMKEGGPEEKTRECRAVGFIRTNSRTLEILYGIMS